MAQTNFAYASASNDVLDVDLSLAIFADRPHVLAQIREDAVNGGFRVTSSQTLMSLLEGDALPLGDVVLVDCPAPDAADLAALTRLDMRAAQAGAQLIVATGLDALDDVFACLDQSGAQLLVDPVRSDVMLALGRVRVTAPARRVREMAGDDRLALLRLTEQIGQIAAQIERLGSMPEALQRPERLSRLAAPAFTFAQAPSAEDTLLRRPRPALPDPRLVRRLIRSRQQRARYFDAEMFADPAWDMLLDLTAARAEMKRVSVTSLCIASGVPPTTALRWIGQLVDAGLFQRVEDQCDRRRAFIELTDKAADAMARYFDAVEEQADRPI
ncbi:MAG: MarR family transcriptional regulator [Novosphingobium sp.]